MGTAFQRERLLKLAEFLIKLDKDKFEFSSVVEHSIETDGHLCGTVCCAIGWTPKVFPDLARWIVCNTSEELVVQHIETGEKEYILVGKNLFGITWGEAQELFTPNDIVSAPWNEEDGMLGDHATPEEVGRSIQRFVNWKMEGGSL